MTCSPIDGKNASYNPLRTVGGTVTVRLTLRNPFKKDHRTRFASQLFILAHRPRNQSFIEVLKWTPKTGQVL
jgi:hypothetical protein